jgi:large conductance mechanosensitive channel
VLSPIIGLFTRQNFDSLELNVIGITLRYGAFVTSVINFAIMAFVVFLMVRAMNRLLSLGEKKVQPPPPRLCPYCKTTLHPEATRCPACTSQLTQGA